MFGYIVVNKEELKIKDYNRYKSYYCGVCHSLRHNYGLPQSVVLTYDMTFLAVLLSSLYCEDEQPKKAACVVHPIKKHTEIVNEFTDYAAAMNIMLAYYKLMDDWQDEKKFFSAAGAAALKAAFKKARKRYPDKAEIILSYIDNQKSLEQKGELNIEKAAEPTGIMLGELFDARHDEWSCILKKIGLFLGKYIYILDAYDDLEKDRKKYNYNPLINVNEDIDEYCGNILTLYAAECSRHFEILPIVDNLDILRNILYAGMWNRFVLISQAKKSKDRKELKVSDDT